MSQTSHNLNQPSLTSYHSTAAAHSSPSLSVEPTISGNGFIQTCNSLSTTPDQDASASQQLSHQTNTRTFPVTNSIVSVRPSSAVFPPAFRPNLAPFENLALLPSPRSRGPRGCPAWLANAMSHTPMLPPTNVPKTTVQPAASSRLAPQEASSSKGLGKRKARGADYGPTEDGAELQALPSAQRAVPPGRPKKQKLDIEMWDSSRHCDFCNQTYRFPITMRHINSGICRKNKAKYEIEFGPVPPGLRRGQGHRGSQGQPGGIVLAANVPAIAADLIIDSHLRQQWTAPMAAYQDLNMAQNPPNLPASVLMVSQSATTQLISAATSYAVSDHQGSASTSENGDQHYGVTANFQAGFNEGHWANATAMTALGASGLEVPVQSSQKPGYSLPVFDSRATQPSNFETGHFVSGAFPGAVGFEAGLWVQGNDNPPCAHEE